MASPNSITTKGISVARELFALIFSDPYTDKYEPRSSGSVDFRSFIIIFRQPWFSLVA